MCRCLWVGRVWFVCLNCGKLVKCLVNVCCFMWMSSVGVLRLVLVCGVCFGVVDICVKWCWWWLIMFLVCCGWIGLRWILICVMLCWLGCLNGLVLCGKGCCVNVGLLVMKCWIVCCMGCWWVIVVEVDVVVGYYVVGMIVNVFILISIFGWNNDVMLMSVFVGGYVVLI